MAYRLVSSVDLPIDRRRTFQVLGFVGGNDELVAGVYLAESTGFDKAD